MEGLKENVDLLRKQIQNTYNKYEQILNDRLKEALEELNHLYNQEVKKISSQDTHTLDDAGGQVYGEKTDKNKLFQSNYFVWNSNLEEFGKFMKQSFGYFSSIIPKEKSCPSFSSLSKNASKVEKAGTNSKVSKNDDKNVSLMQIRCKFGRLGSEEGQFNSPHGFCLGLREEVLVADTHNHRIQVFAKNGTFMHAFGITGKEKGELWYPRKIAVIKSNGNFVVCDRGSKRSRMQIFTMEGNFVREIALDYIDIVSGLVITEDDHIAVVDSVKSSLFVISQFGDLHHWYDCSGHIIEPSDIAVWKREFYVCDFKGHSVAVFSEDGSFVRRIGNENITSFPNGIDISDDGDVLIGDSHGNKFHVAVFSKNGLILSEFECPHVKLSRCCGLKITSEGYVVTLAKNNHHALVLNTLYL